MGISICLINPSYSAAADLVEQRIRDLNNYGTYTIKYPPARVSAINKLGVDSVDNRLAALMAALTDQENPVVLATRGGYGASDLLPLISWQQLQGTSPRWLVGFSDITALLSALWVKLRWPGIHGPMPGSPLWGLNGYDDVSQLCTLFKHGQVKKGMLRISPIGQAAMVLSTPVTGWLFGGCFSVLTSLIATPYLPKTFAGAILLFEDTGENAGRLFRHWNQWLQSGLFTGVQAIILGKFTGVDATINEAEIKAEMARRSAVPCWSSDDFGHVSPNFPFVIGARGDTRENQQELHWEL